MSIPPIANNLIDQCQTNVNGIQDHCESLLQNIRDGSLTGLDRADKDIIGRAANRINDLRCDLNTFMLAKAVEITNADAGKRLSDDVILGQKKKCTRAACNLPAQGCIHTVSGAEYCVPCARRINEETGLNLVRFPT